MKARGKETEDLGAKLCDAEVNKISSQTERSKSPFPTDKTQHVASSPKAQFSIPLSC